MGEGIETPTELRMFLTASTADGFVTTSASMKTLSSVPVFPGSSCVTMMVELTNSLGGITSLSGVDFLTLGSSSLSGTPSSAEAAPLDAEDLELGTFLKC